MTERALVKNAADPEQVTKAGREMKWNRAQELEDLRAVLKLPEGRRFLWRVLEETKAFASIYEASAKIHYNAGKQDVGHFLMGEITDASEEAFLVMMREAKERKEKR